MAAGKFNVPENGLNGEVKETRILLIGKTGVGKSAVGNSILGQNLFETSVGSRTVIKSSEAKSSSRFGRNLVVVDTPGFLDTDKNTNMTAREMSKILGLVQPGFHALVYVMGPEKFSDECMETRDVFFNVFGEAVTKFTIIVITHLDLLREERFDPDEYLSFTTKEFRELQKKCGHRVLFFDNKADKQTLEKQIQDLLHRVDEIDSLNHSPYFTNFYLKLVHAYFKLYDMRDDINFNKAKRELLRRASRTLGLEQPIYWDYITQTPIRKPKLDLPKDPMTTRKASHPEIRPFTPLRFGQKPIPESRGISSFTRRYSVCADASKMTLATTSKPTESVDNDINIIEVVDEDLSDFNEDILHVFEDIDKPTDENTVETTSVHTKDGYQIKEKDSYEYFKNFFSFFLAPIVNVKKTKRKR